MTAKSLVSYIAVGVFVAGFTVAATADGKKKKETNAQILAELQQHSLAEIPAHAAAMIQSSPAFDRKAYAQEVVEAAIQVKPSLSPAIVRSAAAAVPEYASSIATAAIAAQPAQRSLIVQSAIAAAPQSASEIRAASRASLGGQSIQAPPARGVTEIGSNEISASGNGPKKKGTPFVPGGGTPGEIHRNQTIVVTPGEGRDKDGYFQTSKGGKSRRP